ncbi:glycosyltransferase [Novosphingobium sp. PhB165]|uniref:glycosyltransferase n=1 Tax=Novosphingobium sp. PhB165 TaxID=2485105 RepID=UPI0014049C3C|nr:glycosyltransferase [Novosphingobium sp. PhB165]
MFVINSLAGGGAERVFTTLVKELSARECGLAITVALLDDESEEAYSLPEDIPVERLGTRGGMLRSITQLRRVVARLRPDVTVSFLSRANVAAVVAMRRIGRPAIISERVNTTAHLRSGRFGFLSRLLIRSTYPSARQIIAVSEGVARTLEEDFAIERERICVIYNPVDLDRIQRLAAAEPEIPVSAHDFVTMGRLVANKNTAMAIRALAASQTDGRLILLGDGPLHGELEALAHSLGIADRVHLAGFLANPYAVLARAGCYLLTSDAEGFPNAMLEAMACGLPVVATDCPSGPAEILQVALGGSEPAFGAGGALVAMNDHRAMAYCMDRLVTPPARERAAQEGKARIDAFSVERAVDAFRETILKAAAGAGVPPE